MEAKFGPPCPKWRGGGFRVDNVWLGPMPQGVTRVQAPVIDRPRLDVGVEEQEAPKGPRADADQVMPRVAQVFSSQNRVGINQRGVAGTQQHVAGVYLFMPLSGNDRRFVAHGALRRLA